MFAPDLQFVGFTACEWNRLLEAFRRPEPVQVEERRRAGGVILVTERRQLIKLLHSRRGRIEPHTQPWPEALPDIAKRHAVDWVVELQQGTLQALFDRFADGVKREDDYLKQGLALLGLLRQLEAENRVGIWPERLSRWPLPSHRAVMGALDAICPIGQTLLLGVFKKGELYAALAARRGSLGFDRVVGPSLLRQQMGLVPGDWTRDYRHLLRAAEELVGPVCVGCFGELVTFQGLAQAARPGAWAQAVAIREVILTPVVPALAIPLGIDVGLAALRGVRALAERAKSVPWLTSDGPLAGFLGRVHGERSSASHLETILGFDPLALLYKLVEKRPPSG